MKVWFGIFFCVCVCVLLQIHTFQLHPEVDTHFVGMTNSVFDKAFPYVFSDSIFLDFYPYETCLN